VLFVSDNLSSDVHSPAWFARYTAEHYRKMASIAHENAKVVSVHIDGRLRGLLRAVADCGIDGADAVTPAPWGDLTPAQCRAEAGTKLVLSGGVPPDSFVSDVPLHLFDEQVQAWLDLRRQSPALVIAPGDCLPPNGELDRVTRMVGMACEATF
jgi:uroporphyrinogen-III decarboxylase